MAATDQINRLRLMIDDPAGSSQTYSDTQLSALIDQADGDLVVTAAELWQEKAAAYSSLVDVSESGSSRKMSDLYRNALAMSKHYRDQLVSEEPIVSQRSRTRSIARQ